MKKIISAMLLTIITMPCFAQTRADYDATVEKFKGFYNALQTDSIYNMFSDRGKSFMSPDKANQTFKLLYGQFGKIDSLQFTNSKENIWLYKTVFDNLVMSLVISLNDKMKMETFRFISYKPDSVTAPKENSNYVLKAATGNIYGSLVVPASDKKMPVVLIIAGSGPTDRNGNNIMGLNTDTYLMLADSLAKAGIASLRYDKRGVGESHSALKSEESLSFDDMIGDAEGFLKMLKDDGRFSKVIVLGHSEGSLIGMIAARSQKATAFISVSGAGEDLGNILERQERTASEELGKKTKVIIDSLRKGYDVNDVPSNLLNVLRPSTQPYMRSLLKYEPTQEIKKLNIPVLLLQGTTDLQVRVADAKMLKKAYPKATLKIIDGMNHVLKQAPADREKNSATYQNPKLPLDLRGLASSIIQFVKDIK